MFHSAKTEDMGNGIVQLTLVAKGWAKYEYMYKASDINDTNALYDHLNELNQELIHYTMYRSSKEFDEIYLNIKERLDVLYDFIVYMYY